MRASGPQESPFKLPAGLAARLDWAVEPERAGRVANVCLAIAVVVYAVLVLWLMRGVGFVEDDLPTFATSNGFSPGALLEPYNGHLIAVTRLIFAGSIRIFGPEHAPIQVAVVVAGAAAAVALFALLRRRLAAYPSLALALVVLFFGTTGVPLLSSVTMFAQASAFGLAAYIALDSQLRRRDLIACALLILSVLSFEVGVAFAVGAAAWILVETGRWRRIWIAAIPVVLYAAWYVWAPPYDAGQLSNALLIPSYAASSAAAALSALTGLSADFADLSPQGVLDTGWGQLIAVLLAIATAVQVYRRGISGLMMAGVGILAVLWIGGGLTLTIGFRVPESARYAYPVAIALILIFSAAFSGYLSGRRGLIVSAVFLVIAMPLNLWELRSGALATRAKSDLGSRRPRDHRDAARSDRSRFLPRLQPSGEGRRVPRGERPPRLDRAPRRGASLAKSAGQGLRPTTSWR